MKLGENGGRMAMLAAGVGAALAVGSERAEAQGFGDYCAPLAGGESLELELDPHGGLQMPSATEDKLVPIFEHGQVTNQGMDALSAYFATGIFEACNTEIATQIDHVGGRVFFVVHPPTHRPFGIDQQTFGQIQANFQACVAEVIPASDWDGNARIDATPDPNDFDEASGLAALTEGCNAQASDEIRLAQLHQQITGSEALIADATARIAASQARQEQLFQSWTQDILNTPNS